MSTPAHEPAVWRRLTIRLLPLLLLAVLGLLSTSCHALVFAIGDDCYHPAPRCGPPVVVVPRRRCR